MRAKRPGRGVPSAAGMSRASGCGSAYALRGSFRHGIKGALYRLPAGPFRTYCLQVTQCSAKMNGSRGSGTSLWRTFARDDAKGEAGLLGEPFSPAAVMTGQRRLGFLFGG